MAGGPRGASGWHGRGAMPGRWDAAPTLPAPGTPPALPGLGFRLETLPPPPGSRGGQESVFWGRAWPQGQGGWRTGRWRGPAQQKVFPSLSFFPFFSAFKKQNNISDLPRLGKLARVLCLAPERFMAVSSRGRGARGDMSSLLLRPGWEAPIHLPSWRPVWEPLQGHLLLSLSLSWLL